MKILQINKFYYPRGGTETYLFGLSELLKKNGHLVISFSMKDDRNLPSKYAAYFADKVEFEKFSLKNLAKIFYNRQAVKNLERLITEEKPDVAHLHNIAHQLSPAIISVLKKHNIPVVQTLHDYKLICPNYRLYSRGEYCEKCRGGKYYQCFWRNCMENSRSKSFLGMLEAYLYNGILKIYDRVDLFIAPSRFMKEVCVRFGVPEEKIKVVYHFLPAPAAGALTDEGGGEKKDNLLYFGRLSKEKGLETLLEAMTGVKKDTVLKIAGAGPDHLNLKFKIKNLKLDERVEILGPKYGEELEALIANASAIIMPSLWPENMPFSLLEAMDQGKTVIASRVGGLTEVIKDGENGFLFAPGDSQALAEKINGLDRATAARIGAAAKETSRKFGRETHYEQILNIYENLAR